MMPALEKSRLSSRSALFASAEFVSAISFHPFNNNRKRSACRTRAKSAAVRPSARNAGIPAMYSRTVTQRFLRVTEPCVRHAL